jgi:flagellar motor protein MotB
MAKGACRCKKEECEECPEWIFTFADLVMLMMGFFVVLWVLKPSPNPNTGKDNVDPDMIKLEAAIRSAFDYVPDPTSKDPVDIQMLIEKLNKLNGPGEGGATQQPVKTPDGTAPDPSDIRPGKMAVEGGKLLFDKGDASTSDEMNKVLDQIVEIIRGHRNVIVVKGHTSLDDFPDDASPQKKMDLSIRRAQAVADYLVAHGVEPEILRVQGCSTYEPLIQRVYTPDSQTLNRRVEVEVSATLVGELQGQKPATEPSDELDPPTRNQSLGDVQ